MLTSIRWLPAQVQLRVYRCKHEVLAHTSPHSSCSLPLKQLTMARQKAHDPPPRTSSRKGAFYHSYGHQSTDNGQISSAAAQEKPVLRGSDLVNLGASDFQQTYQQFRTPKGKGLGIINKFYKPQVCPPLEAFALPPTPDEL